MIHVNRVLHSMGRLIVVNEFERKDETGILSFLKRRPLRLDILTAFTVLLVITVLVIIFYAHHRNSKAILALSDAMIEQTREIVIKEGMLFLKPASTLVRLSSIIGPNFYSALPDSEAFESYAIEILREFPQIAMVNIADEKGNFLMPKRMPDGTIATKIINRNDTPAAVTWKYRNILGEVIKIEKNDDVNYDPRVRPWYEEAKKTGGTCWTDLYIFHTDQKPGMTVSHPVIKADGKLIGVLGFDIELGRLSDFLKNLKVGKTGMAFIINGKKEVIAYPEISCIAIRENEGFRPKHVEELGIDRISAFYREYENSQKNKFIFKTKGERYIGSLIDFPKSFGGGWKLAILVPEDDFIGPIKKTRQVTIIISIIILLIAVLIAALLSQSISRPILRVAREAEKIKDFKLEGELDIDSNIREIQLLKDAVKRMKASLRAFTRYAPEEIVREVVAKGREAILGGEKREVTLLFCDLKGFTKFSEKKMPEEVVSLLNDHFDVMVRLISQHRGFVIDFLGDSVFAAFGSLEEDIDHANHAVRCAVEMQLERFRLNKENESKGLPPMEMGIGMNTGSCVVGNMGSTIRIKYGVAGHMVNLGARIESFSVGGQVLVSDATYRLVKDHFCFTGPFEVWGKGVGEAIRIWNVGSVKGEPSAKLPPVVPELEYLPQPVPVTFRLLHGKQIDSETRLAHLIRLSASGSEIRTDQTLELLAAIQIQLAGGSEDVVPIDGKVVGIGTGADRFIVRFTGVDATQTEAIGLILKTRNDGA